MSSSIDRSTVAANRTMQSNSDRSVILQRNKSRMFSFFVCSNESGATR